MSAVIDGSPVIVAYLMKRGADWRLRHKNGMTAMDYARKALTESRTEEQRAAAIEVEVALRSGRARQRLGSLRASGMVWRASLGIGASCCCCCTPRSTSDPMVMVPDSVVNTLRLVLQ